MANGAAFEDAVKLAHNTPTIDVGCHLVLVGGDAAAAPGTRLPKSVRFAWMPESTTAIVGAVPGRGASGPLQPLETPDSYGQS